MKKFLFLTALFLSGCFAVDTGLPRPSGPYLMSPACDYVEDIYMDLGSPDYCFPDQCCVWSYYNYDGWYCEETWCEYSDFQSCWWDFVGAECY